MSDNESAIEIEARGAAAGLNPMFGEWRQTFAFGPVPYRDGGAKLRAFQTAVQSALTNQFVFSDEIQLVITLFLDVQTVLETSETADVDNYAKAILDALKGPMGIIIDDTQVQSLTISWIDSQETYFEIEARGSPDDFLLKPLKLYEMPNGLFYPVSAYTWDSGSRKAVLDHGLWGGLLITQVVSGAEKRARHILRQSGRDRLGAYREGKYTAGLNRGFHKSRAADSGFETVPIASWRREYATWAADNAEQASAFEALALSVEESRDKFVDALAKLNT